MIRYGVVLFALAVGAMPAQRSGIRLHNDGEPGGLRIENVGPTISLASKVTVERFRDGKWIVTPVRFELIDKCITADTPPCRELAAGASFVPKRWNGYTCSGQCVRSCRSNNYAGPGRFRFVVVTCDGKGRVTGPEFTMAPRVNRQ